MCIRDSYKATQALAGDNRAADSNGLRSTVKLAPGEDNPTYDLGVIQTASLGDFVWEDTNSNGVQDPGEPPVPGTIMKVTGNGETHTTSTDENGKWSVTGLTPGVEYTVTFTPPAGYKPTDPNRGNDRAKDSNKQGDTVTLTPGENNTTYDFGLIKVQDPEKASVGDRVWVDENADGIQGDDEKNGVPGITVEVTGGGEDPRTTTTDSKGNWRIDGLTPGVEYTVTFTLPNDTTVTKPVQGNDRGKDSNEVTSTVTLKSGEYNSTYDLGVVSASVGDRVWLDEGKDSNKANGIQDDDETTGVKDVVVRVSRPGEDVRETTTGNDGNWRIDGLTPGVEYRVEFDAPDGYSVSPSKKGDAAKDSNGLSDTVAALKSGENNTSYDLGLYKPSPTTTTETTKETVTEVTSTPCDCEPTTTTTTATKNVEVTKTETIPTTVKETVTNEVTTTVNGTPTTITETSVVETVKEVPTTVKETVVKTTTNKVVVTDENTAIIGDKVYIDNNGDGKQDPDENEGVPNVTVIVTGKDGEEQRTVTDKDGNWQLVVQPGDYTVKFETDRVPSVPEQVERSIVVKPGEKKDDIDLGVLRPGTVGDRVWEDTNGDGKQDEGEKGVPNVIVKVARDGEPTRTTYTDENGKWTVEGLTPNTEYRVEFVTPEGWTRTNTPAETVTLKPGATNLDYDLGIKRVPTDKPVQPGQFGGSIVINNPDGSREGVENVIVRATPPAGVDEPVRTSTSDKGGSWTITDLTPDTEYTVTYIIPRGYQVINLPKGATLDKDGNVTVTAKVNRELPTNLGFDLEVERGSSIPGTPATVTVTETPVTNTTEVQVQSSNDFLAKCWANATQSPYLYLAPIALIGAVGGELARPYMGAVNEQLNQLNAQLQGAFRRDTPEWGDGGRGADREDPFAEFRAQIDAANRQLQQMAADPNIQRLGGIAAGVLGLIAAGTIIYDWCSNEPGEAKTASSRRGGAAPTTAPTTTSTTSTTSTEPTPKP